MKDEQKIARHDAIIEVRKQIRGCFGIADLIFNTHKLDEDRSKVVRGYAIAAGITKAEMREIVIGFLYNKNCIKEHIDKQLKKTDKFFAKLID